MPMMLIEITVWLTAKTLSSRDWFILNVSRGNSECAMSAMLVVKISPHSSVLYCGAVRFLKTLALVAK